MHKELKDNQKAGIKYVEVADYQSMRDVFLKYRKELVGYAKKFSKVKYTKTYQIMTTDYYLASRQTNPNHSSALYWSDSPWFSV